MTSKRFVALLFGVALAAPATAAFAGSPGEPLIFTESRDPDPDFVAPREPPHRARPARAHKTAKPTMNQVMEDLGRVTGQLELLGEQVRQRRRSAQMASCGAGEDQSGAEHPCSQ